MPFLNERTELGRTITIDKERGGALKYSDQVPREPLYIFEFNDCGKSFSFWARKFTNLSADKKRLIRWVVEKVLSDSWEECNPNIRKDMESALKCYGSTGAAELSPEGIKEVTVEFRL